MKHKCHHINLRKGANRDADVHKLWPRQCISIMACIIEVGHLGLGIFVTTEVVKHGMVINALCVR
jgi:hypothetical protein